MLPHRELDVVLYTCLPYLPALLCMLRSVIMEDVRKQSDLAIQLVVQTGSALMKRLITS